jgi:hypothetical protein
MTVLSRSLRDILEDVEEDDVINTFMTIRKRRPKKLCRNLICYLSLCCLHSKLLVCYFGLFVL